MSDQDSNTADKIEIQISSRLQEILENGTDAQKADANSCMALAQPPVVSFISKCCVPELGPLSLDETMNSIVGAIQVGLVPGTPYLASATRADKRVGRGSMYFDVVVTIQLPDSARRARVIINIEAQNTIRSWEWITGRIDAYLAELIVSQLGNEVIYTHYDKLVNVYSIWLLLSPKAEYVQNHVMYEELGERWQDLQKYASDALRNTFRKERAKGDKSVDLDRLLAESIKQVEDAIHPTNSRNKETRFRRHYPPKSRMHTVKILLGNPAKAAEPLEKFVDVLFDEQMSADDKGDMLESEFGIPKTITLMEDMRKMGAYSAAILEKTTRELKSAHDKEIKGLNKEIKDLNKEIEDLKQRLENFERAQAKDQES